MCDRESNKMQAANLTAAIGDAFPGGRRADIFERASGSRRWRVWELPVETHCPVIGVCLPIMSLRKLVGKALGRSLGTDDYELHVRAVAECAHRCPIAEVVQRELDRRYATAIHRLAQLKTTEALSASWNEAREGGEVAEALWATLTHPRCEDALRQEVCHDVHMFQHQAGASVRADLRRLAAVREENAALAGELQHARERHAGELQRRDADITALQAQLTPARGRLIAREAEVGSLRARLDELERNVPALQARVELQQRVEQQKTQIQQLERDRAHWQRHAQQVEERARALSVDMDMWRARAGQAGTAASSGATLRDKSVLCVGGRQATVPVYRQLIECSGARFLHHDGGEEDNAAQLEANLATADLVICQTGCVSHGAYWRVKDHCKRTGKQCVFVEKPSASSLARCLRTLDAEAITICAIDPKNEEP